MLSITLTVCVLLLWTLAAPWLASRARTPQPVSRRSRYGLAQQIIDAEDGDWFALSFFVDVLQPPD